jgi:signal transduction histidine kinase
VTVRGDEALLERLVGNLVENGVRYGCDVRVALRSHGDDAVLTVSNGGDRIPQRAVASLSEPFQRLHRGRADGSGLGLSIVDAVATAHGGALRLAAPASGGLEAEVRLPAVTER